MACVASCTSSTTTATTISRLWASQAAPRYGLPAGGASFDLSGLARLGREMEFIHKRELAAGKGFSSYLMALVQVKPASVAPLSVVHSLALGVVSLL